jgi:hypothetical protein
MSFDNVCRTDVPAETFAMRELLVHQHVPDRRSNRLLLGLTYSWKSTAARDSYRRRGG